MTKLKIGFAGIALIAAVIIAAVTGVVYACPQTTGADCSGHDNDHDQRIDLQLKDQDQPWSDGVNKTWTALNMAPGQTFAFTGNFVGLRINAPSLAQITCDYQVTNGLPDHMAQQMILTRCVYDGTLWTINCLTGIWQIYATNSHGLLQGNNPQWKLTDVDKDGQITFYDLKKNPLNYLPIPDSNITDSTQFQISIKFASTAGNDLQGNTLNMIMMFTATSWNNSCNNYGVDPKVMQLFFDGQNVTKASTSTFITSSYNPSVYGQSVTFTATIKAASNGGGIPTGSVTFSDGSTVLKSNVPLVGGSASIKVSTLTVGSHCITAVYSGDNNFASSTSNLVQRVRGKTVCSWPSRPGPCNCGQTSIFKVQIGWQGSVTPTGKVTFFDGSNSIGTGSWSGDTAILNCSLSAGSHNITAQYSGDDNYDGSTSDVVNQTVNKVSSATTLKSSVNQTKYGNNVTFTATVVATTPDAGSPSGSVTFKDGTSTLGTITLSGGKATYNSSKLSVGIHSITAVYSGDGNFNSSTSNIISQVISK